MKELKYISFDTSDTTQATDYFEKSYDGEIVTIKIGSKEFEVFISAESSERNLENFEYIGENQYELVDVILALKKLTKFLELSVDISFSKSLVE